MNKKGIGTVELVIGVAIVGLIAAAVIWHRSIAQHAHEDAVREGRKAALLEVAQRDNAQLAAAQQRILELQADKARLEGERRQAVAAIDAQREREVRDVHASKDRIISCLRDDACRLRYLGRAADAGCPVGDRGGRARASGAAGERDAPAAGQPAQPVVGDEDAAIDDIFTAGLLAEGDEAIADLTACQAIVLGDRGRVRVPNATDH